MRIQDIQKLTLLDFPGRVACTVFTAGCNLRCPFCHNATLVLGDAGEGMTEDEVLSFLKKRKGVLDGICITGGEPLLNADIGDFIKKVREIGYAVKLDTNGTFPERLEKLLGEGLLDYVAMDVKSADDTYANLCGVKVDMAKIHRSIDLSKNSGVAHEFRTTAVKDLHKPQDFTVIARLLGDERYFIQCFKDSGYILSDGCEAFSKPELEEILAEVKKYTPRAELRGV